MIDKTKTSDSRAMLCFFYFKHILNHIQDMTSANMPGEQSQHLVEGKTQMASRCTGAPGSGGPT